MYMYIHVCGGNRCIYTFVVVADVYMYLVVVYICIYTFVAVVYMYIHVCSLSFNNDYYCTIASIVC